MNFANDANSHHLTDNITEGGLMNYENGVIKVPTGIGLSVLLDEDKMKHYEEKGDC